MTVIVDPVKNGDSLLCPVCGKEFIVTDKTRFIISGEYTCSLKCFVSEVKKRDANRPLEKKRKRNI